MLPLLLLLLLLLLQLSGAIELLRPNVKDILYTLEVGGVGWGGHDG
jgi:hypothetical protein